MTLRLHQGLVVAAVLCCTTAAFGQSRFGFDVFGGGEIPLSPAVRQHVLIEPDTAVDAAPPRLADLRTRPGMVFGVRLLVGQLEVGYRYERLDWTSPAERCVGDRPAVERGDGTIDDSEVRYRCNDRRDRLDGWTDGFDPLVIHAIGGGARFALVRPGASRERAVQGTDDTERSELYLIAAGAALLTTWADERHESRLRAGVELAGGGGVEIPLDRRFAFFVETRYRIGWLATPARASDGAARAVATGRPVAQAVFDTTHRLDLTTGLRVDLR